MVMLRKLDCLTHSLVCFPIIIALPFTSLNSDTNRILIPKRKPPDLLPYNLAKPLKAFFLSSDATSMCSAIYFFLVSLSNYSYLALLIYFHRRATVIPNSSPIFSAKSLASNAGVEYNNHPFLSTDSNYNSLSYIPVPFSFKNHSASPLKSPIGTECWTNTSVYTLPPSYFA